ncbi:MAG: hypothetical protein ACFFDH_00385 [Promethearchaeota archaeon]
MIISFFCKKNKKFDPDEIRDIINETNLYTNMVELNCNYVFTKIYEFQTFYQVNFSQINKVEWFEIEEILFVLPVVDYRIYDTKLELSNDKQNWEKEFENIESWKVLIDG